jgi:hypothetical protein
VRIAFDIELMRQACPILAAALGADPYAADWFDPEDWLVAPTEAMRVYELPPEYVAQLQQKVKARPGCLMTRTSVLV